MSSRKIMASPDNQSVNPFLDCLNFAPGQSILDFQKKLQKLFKNLSTQSIEMRLDADSIESQRQSPDSSFSEVLTHKTDSTDRADNLLRNSLRNRFENHAQLPNRNTRNPNQLNNVLNGDSSSLHSDTHVSRDENALLTATNSFLANLPNYLTLQLSSSSLPDYDLPSAATSVLSLPSPSLVIDTDLNDPHDWNHLSEVIPDSQDVLNSILNEQYLIDSEASLDAVYRFQTDRGAPPRIDKDLNADLMEMYLFSESSGEFGTLSYTDDLFGELEPEPKTSSTNAEYDYPISVFDCDRLSTFNDLSGKISAFRKEDEQGQSRKRTYVKMKDCDSENFLKEDFKKERRRQQNRQAANKWRKKKKDTIDTLQKELKDTKTELEKSQKENKILKQIIANNSKKSCKYNYNGTINNF